MPVFSFLRRCLASLWLLPLLMVGFATAQGDRAQEVRLTPDSVNTDPGWALDRVGGKIPDGPHFTYPDTTNPVRLYLIDTAVRNPESFVAANPKLTFEGTILVRGSNDPTTSTPRDHGTQMLSLISGMETGIAAGTPIHVLNYDIYPDEGTTKTLLAEAIYGAVEHSINPNTQEKMRSVICVATSSMDPTDSYSIEQAIAYALSEGIPVVVSAGNLNADAANYVPCKFGVTDGVICAGASNATDLKLSISNWGAPVDLLAPGEGVRTRKESATSAFEPMTGTSPAAALVAGYALAELSINGSLTPAQVESAIKASAMIPAGALPVLRTDYASAVTATSPDGPVILPASPIALTATASETSSQSFPADASGEGAITASLDSDSDGVPDMVEIFHHGCSSGTPASPVLSLTADHEIQYKFPIAFDLFNNSNPFVLDNGYTWGVRCTTNLKSWEAPVGSLSKVTDSMGQSWLIATFPAEHPTCFVQIEIHPPAP